jgi:hypothetical protein
MEFAKSVRAWVDLVQRKIIDGTAAAAGVRLIVWCKACQHEVDPYPAEMATRYGAETAVLRRSPRPPPGKGGPGRVLRPSTSTARCIPRR